MDNLLLWVFIIGIAYFFLKPKHKKEKHSSTIHRTSSQHSSDLRNFATDTDWANSLGCQHNWKFTHENNFPDLQKKWYECSKCGRQGHIDYSSAAGESKHILP